MEAATAKAADGPSSQVEGASEGDERVRRAKARAAGDPGRELLEHVAEGAELSDEEEYSALDWLLGDRAPTVHDIDAQVETPRGMRKLTFVVVAADAKKIDAIEQRNVSQLTGRLDRITADCEIVAEMVTALVDGSGREVDPRSEAYRTVRRRKRDGSVEDFTHASTALAIDERFRNQLGVIQGVAAEVRRIAGYGGDRVSSAKRRAEAARLVSAALD